MRRTKIVCTVGPASSSEEILTQMVEAGMDLVRLNFSHGVPEEHAEVIRRVRIVEEKVGKPLGILQDLQGPKIRLGRIAGGAVTVEKEDPVLLTSRPVLGTREVLSTTFPRLAEEVRPGDFLLLADGLVHLEVVQIEGADVRCRVVVGGTLTDHKGIHLPHGVSPVSLLTEKDQQDLLFGIAQRVDYVAVSFVRRAADLLEVRELLNEHRATVPLIAKVERPEALADLEEILRVADGVMVARGDLGVAMPLEEIPVAQKKILQKARVAQVPVIIATEMLESMMEHPRPTRAEVSDVANAIFDGADAVMLSEETATGRYPVEAVATMAKVAQEAEKGLPSVERQRREDYRVGFTFPHAISEAACHVAWELKARAIVAFTETGSTARLLSQYRPVVPIIALTPSRTVRRRCTLYRGVTTREIRRVEHTDEMIREVEGLLLADGTVRMGDIVAIVSGAPMWVRGTTNLLTLHRIGEPR